MIISKLLMKTNIVEHGFFNKKNGFSKGIYKSLNCGFGSKDNKKNIIKNLNYVKKKIKSKKYNISLPYQIHSSKFFFITKYSKKKITGDGLITNINNLPIGVLTADCSPILILDSRKKIIAAVHVGWKGAYKQIVIKVLKKLIKLGSKKKDIIVVIGPTIAQKNYEVGNDLYESFINKDDESESNFIEKGHDKWLFSLHGEAKRILGKYDIDVDFSSECTFESESLFSYRRDQTKNRILSIIWRNEWKLEVL